MKKRFMVILLAGGLTIGLCGCGGSSSTAAPAPSSTEQAAVEQEGVSAENNLPDTSAQENAAANDVASKAPDAEGYSTDELENLWSSGILTKEDIEYKTATGEISYEVYEEFLDLMAGDEEFEASQSEEIPEKISEDGAPSIDIDISKLLATHVVEFEDVDGYTIRETCQLSPIFREDDRETMYALWEALGQDVASFPSEVSLYDKNYLLRDARDSASCNKLEYIIGTYMIENRTDGYRYDKIQLQFGCLASPYSNDDGFELTYFED